MRIILYKFNKKSNSTARPSNSTPKIELDNVQIKTPSSINAPLLQLAKDKDPNGYNYIYIPSFNRYYFVQDITYGIGVWLVSCVTDVLASFREDILASNQYVLRSASDSDSTIVDDFYTTKGSSTYVRNNLTTVVDPDNQISIPDYFNTSYDSGVFVIGIISNNSSGITYYELTYTGFSSLVSQLMQYIPNDFQDVSDGIAKSLFNPLQYITSCKWYPTSLVRGITPVTSSINIGGYNISLSGIASVKPLNNRSNHFRSTVTIPKHPNSNTLKYLQLYPYSTYNLVFEPFGNIPLDSVKMFEGTSLTLDWYLDNGTGDTELFVYNGNKLIANVNSSMGVEVQLSQLTVDVIGGVTSIAGAIGDSITAVSKGKIAGAVGSIASGIGNAINSMLPQLSTSGARGSFLAYSLGTPQLHGLFVDVVESDVNKYGAPLCQNKTLSTLSGYTLCSNAVVNYSTYAPLAVEADEVNSLLNTGVYIE